MVYPGQFTKMRNLATLLTLFLLLSSFEGVFCSTAGELDNFVSTVCYKYRMKIEKEVIRTLQAPGTNASKVARIFQRFEKKVAQYLKDINIVSFEECYLSCLIEQFLKPELDKYAAEHPDFAATLQAKEEQLFAVVSNLFEEGFNEFERLQNTGLNAKQPGILSETNENAAPSFPLPGPISFDLPPSLNFEADINAPLGLSLKGWLPSSLSQTIPAPTGPLSWMPPLTLSTEKSAFEPLSLFERQSLVPSSLGSFPADFSLSRPSEISKSEDSILSLMGPSSNPLSLMQPARNEPLSLMQPANKSPLSLIKPEPEAPWSVSDFGRDLQRRLEEELLPSDDVLFSMDFTVRPVISLIQSFPQNLAVAIDSEELKLSGSFDQVLEALKEFFKARIYTPVLNDAGAITDFDFLNDVVESKLVHFVNICATTLQNHYRDRSDVLDAASFFAHPAAAENDNDDGVDFTTLSDENDYIRLAVRVGIDHTRPQELLYQQNVQKLEAMGIDIGHPNFQTFLTDMIRIYSNRDASSENDPNLSASIPLKQNSPPTRNSPCSFGIKRMNKNEKIMRRLGAMLLDRSFLSQLRKVANKAVDMSELAEEYFVAIITSLKRLVQSPQIFNAIEDGESMPQKAQKTCFEFIARACKNYDMENFGTDDSYGEQVAEQVSIWLSSKLFASDQKTRAVENWNSRVSLDDELEGGKLEEFFSPESDMDELVALAKSFSPVNSPAPEGLFSKVKASPAVKKASFADEPERDVTTFAYYSSPKSIGSEEAMVNSNLDDLDVSLIPPFPFCNSAAPQSILLSPEYLEYTAAYLRQHGDCKKLKLKERKDAINTAVVAELATEFADVDPAVREEIAAAYRSVLDFLMPTKNWNKA